MKKKTRLRKEEKKRKIGERQKAQQMKLAEKIMHDDRDVLKALSK
jgi:hypothetical protein